jgi:hypothetical protein
MIGRCQNNYSVNPLIQFKSNTERAMPPVLPPRVAIQQLFLQQQQNLENSCFSCVSHGCNVSISALLQATKLRRVLSKLLPGLVSSSGRRERHVRTSSDAGGCSSNGTSSVGYAFSLSWISLAWLGP